MGYSFGLGNIGDYHFGNSHPFLSKMLILPEEYKDEDDPFIADSGIKCLYGLTGHQAIEVIRQFFERCRHYKLTEDDRTLYKDFNPDTVQTCMVQLALLQADCAKMPYETVEVA
jgi:hypothetical protein